MTIQGKERKRTKENIRKFWEKPSQTTIRDHYFRLLEINEIKKLLKGKVLDVGCGDGYSTSQYAKSVDICGIDYSHELIKRAKRRKSRAKFIVTNVSRLPFPDREFDVVIGSRILINLPTWNDQKKAILEMARVLKNGGLYICSEVTEQGHSKVNRFRNMFGLDNLERYWHNLYIDETKFMPFVSHYFKVLEIKRFGMYHFISKVLHPLIHKNPKFLSKINKVAMGIGSKIINFKDCSHQVMFVLKRNPC